MAGMRTDARRPAGQRWPGCPRPVQPEARRPSSPLPSPAGDGNDLPVRFLTVRTDLRRTWSDRDVTSVSDRGFLAFRGVSTLVRAVIITELRQAALQQPAFSVVVHE